MPKGEKIMAKQTLPPAPPRKSQYGVDPSHVPMRGAELAGMTSVTLAELFPAQAAAGGDGAENQISQLERRGS